MAMTAQEFFTKSLLAMRQRNYQVCKDLGGNPIYKDPDHDFGCLIGIHIPREAYRPKMEGVLVRELLHEYKDSLLPIFSNVSGWLMADVQSAHDSFINSEIFESNMKQIAKTHGLEFTPLVAPD